MMLNHHQCFREAINSENSYAGAMKKNDYVVGQVPQMISKPCSIFQWKGGLVICEIIDLKTQGGMDVPCCLHFVGQKMMCTK